VEGPQGEFIYWVVEAPAGGGLAFSIEGPEGELLYTVIEAPAAGSAEASVERPEGSTPGAHIESAYVTDMLSIYEQYWAGETVNLKAYLLSQLGL
jgi:hypothetical protein